jgi:Zn-dependent peptidase ImmA (M78 family)
MHTEVDINTQMLTWAINRAGYDFNEFSVKVPNIIEWIDGNKKPTLKQLEDFSRKVYLPFGYFFLPEPPKENLPIPFFRTNSNLPVSVTVNVFDTIMIMQQRQDWLKEYLHENDYDLLPFVGRYATNYNIKEIVDSIRFELGLAENWASEYNTWEEALSKLVEHIENIGIVAVFNGVVENNTSRTLNVDDCRGFVLVDQIAPLMFVNNTDSKSAQMFTIVHELAHIWTGHSAGFDFRTLQPASDPNEILCDKIAAEFLVPERLFGEVWDNNPIIRAVSRYFKVSELVIARRALDTGKITKTQFFGFYNEYIKRDFDRRENQPLGGNFYATTRKRLGLTFATHINTAVKSGKLLHRDAYKLTSLKGDTFETFFAKHI